MKILIGADVVPTATTESDFIHGNIQPLFGKVYALAQSMDRVIINLECALTDSDNKIRKMGPNLKASPACTAGLLALGVTDAALANNHIFDYGIEGLKDTMAALDNVGISYTGIGNNDTDSRKPYFIECKGKRIGIVNVCEHEYSYALPNRIGANPFDPFLTMQDIRQAKKQCDLLIVLYHGGKEHCRYPSPRLYHLCHEMVLCGADVVLTQHSHCIGCYEKYEGGHILYGQGNFHFVKPGFAHPDGWNTALLVELDMENTLQVKFHPIVMTNTGCDLAEGDTAAKIMQDFEDRNASLADGTWRDGWRDFCFDPERAHYREHVENACQTEQSIQCFAHLLDCEAHTDVWRELYPTWNTTNEL